MHRSYCFLMLSSCAIVAVALGGQALQAKETSYQSHPPVRPLAVVSNRPMSVGPAYYVDGKNGNDANSGSHERPWKTINHAMQKLAAGDVLYLRGGIYYEHVSVKLQGTPEKPITIRSVPGEMVVIDGGMREFFESPSTAWQPVPDGAEGEYQSVKQYPDLGGSADGTNVLGNFGDSMIPLHGYRYLSDLRTNNEYFSNIDASKTEAGEGIYCGPGLFYDVNTGRIHVRLAHTLQKSLGGDNYRGETDPRKLPLVVAGINAGSALSIYETSYLRFQDVVVRGARNATISVRNSQNIEFDGVTSYGGSSAMSVSSTVGLRLWNCACRGIAAPWTFRGSLKYRAIEARIFSASGWSPTGDDNRDFELAHSEFTDCVDGVFIGNVNNVRFHHNLLDNVSDDGMFLTATTAYDGTTHGGNVLIYQNRISRCLTAFAFGVGHGRQKMTPQGRQTGAGVWIYRNVFDFRQPVMYTQPSAEEDRLTSFGRITGDHGSPLWEPMNIYHNTILQAESPFRSYYLGGLATGLGGGSKRQLFNNIIVHATGQPGSVLPPVVPPMTKAEIEKMLADAKPESSPLNDLLESDTDSRANNKKKLANELNGSELTALKKELAKKAVPKAPLPIYFQADGNLHWSFAADFKADELLARFRKSPDFETSKRLYRPGWTAQDIVTDPMFASFNADWQQPVNVVLSNKSPAIDAGVVIEARWPDPLRGSDQGKPDLGAIPAGVSVWNVGMHGRLDVFGSPGKEIASPASPPTMVICKHEAKADSHRVAEKHAMLVEGYPAFDAPLLSYALRRKGVTFDEVERTWLDPAEYQNYSLVAIVGDLPRAKIEPNIYNAQDLKHVEKYLHGGGCLLLMRGNNRLFSSPEGRKFLTTITGTSNGSSEGREILLPNHPWVSHLDAKQPPAWINKFTMQSIRYDRGEAVIGNKSGAAALYRAEVGKGQLIYLGWDIASSLPHGRSSSTVEQELAYEQQIQILFNLVESIYSQQ